MTRDIRAELTALYGDEIEFFGEALGGGTLYDAAIIGVTGGSPTRVVYDYEACEAIDLAEALADRECCTDPDVTCQKCEELWSESALHTSGLLDLVGGAHSPVVVMGMFHS